MKNQAPEIPEKEFIKDEYPAEPLSRRDKKLALRSKISNQVKLKIIENLKTRKSIPQEKLEERIEDLKAKIIAEIKLIYPTSESWKQLRQLQYLRIKVNLPIATSAGKVNKEFTFLDIVSIFGMSSRNFRRKNFLELGSEIYGEVIELEDRLPKSTEYYLDLIKTKIPTFEDWKAISLKGMRNILGEDYRGLQIVSLSFGLIPGKANLKSHLELGAKIYEHNFSYQPKPVYTVDQVMQEIRKQFPTAKELLATDDHRNLRVFGLGFKSISNILEIDTGFDNKAGCRYKELSEIARKVYPDCQDITFSVMDIRQFFQKQMPDPVDWINMTKGIKIDFKIHKQTALFKRLKSDKLDPNDDYINLIDAAKILGINENPIENDEAFLEMGRKIYGDLDIFDQTKKHQDYLNSIIEVFRQYLPDPATLLQMNYQQKRKFHINGKGLFAIARELNIQGDPLLDGRALFNLGKLIYPESKEFQKYTPSTEDIAVEVYKQIVSLRSWAKHKTVESRKTIQIEGLTLVDLAKLFEVSGDPINNYQVYLELGKKFF